MIIETNIKKNIGNLFFRIYFMYVVLMIINFFLTPNPFSALHSGEAGLNQYVTSDNFFLVPAYLVLVTIVFQSLYVHKFILDYKIVLAMCILLISGLYNQGLFTNPMTYIYNSLTFILVSSLAIFAFTINKTEIKGLKKIASILSILLVIGLCLALAFPNRYGLLPFGFSRQSRGEVTFWNITGLFTIFPTISILVYRKYKNKFYICLSLLMTLIILSTETRAQVVLTLLPFLIVILFNVKIVYKFIFTVALIPIFLFYYKAIIVFFVGSKINYSYDISNGRFDLWSYHLQHVKENPFFGSGAFFMERLGDYSGGADSEIGALMWFSENGIIFGTILMLIVLKSVTISLKLLSKGRQITDVQMFFSIIMLSMLPNLIQNYGRILSLEDMIFWFSVFYLNAYGKPFLPYLNLFKEDVRDSSKGYSTVSRAN